MSRGVDANGPQASSGAPWASFNGCLWAASNMGPAQSFWVLKPSYKHFNARSCTQFTFPLRYAGPDVSPGLVPQSILVISGTVCSRPAGQGAPLK